MSTRDELNKALSSDDNKIGLIPQSLCQDSDTDDGQLLVKDLLGLTNKDEKKRVRKILIKTHENFRNKLLRNNQ